MPDDPILEFANALLAEGRRDREVLRRRWNVPSWRAEIEQIASTLERYPLLVPLVVKTIDEELARLGDENQFPTKEATTDADRQDAPVSNV